MIIPYQQISADALQGLIESFIHREGTDYGAVEFSLDDKVAQVKSQLQSGEVVIAYEEATETVNILPRREAQHLLVHGANEDFTP